MPATPASTAIAPRKYLRTREAAIYVGYSLNRFRDLAREHNIPTYGPENNRYRPCDLDVWMECPSAFTSNIVKPRRRRLGGFTPVQA